jgi:hypothetical protein
VLAARQVSERPAAQRKRWTRRQDSA